MQSAPQGGPGLRTRPSKERVDARGIGCGGPVFDPLVRQGGEDAGSLVHQVQRPTGTKRRMWTAATAEASAPAPRARWRHLPREVPHRKERHALGRADPSEGAAMGTSPRSVRPRGPQSMGPGRNECDVFAPWQQEANHAGRPERTRNPTSGSGPRDRNVAREQTVEGVRNSEGGTCRVRQARVERTQSRTSLKGRQNPTRGTGDGTRQLARFSGRRQGSYPERAAKPVGAVRTLASGPAGRRKTSRS
jgi:hypothetical protein